VSLFRKPNPNPEPMPPGVPEYREPNGWDVRWHYISAQYWLAVAEQPGRPDSATSAAAALAQAHAQLGSLAFDITSQVKRVHG
jgi:hypothetical protein